MNKWKDLTMSDIVTKKPQSSKENLVELDYLPGVVDRLMLVIDKMLLLFEIGVIEKKIARGFIDLFAKGAEDEQVVNAVRMAQDEIIPFIMRGEVNHPKDGDYRGSN